MFRIIKNILLRQHNLGSSIGGLKDIVMRTMFYVTALNFIMLVVTSYSVSLRDFMGNYVGWFSFPVFLGILVFILFVAIIIEYKFILPSQWNFVNKQQYEHESPIKKDMEEIKDRLTAMERHMGVKDEADTGKHE